VRPFGGLRPVLVLLAFGRVVGDGTFDDSGAGAEAFRVAFGEDLVHRFS